MKFLMGHNYYRSENPSGEDRSYEAEAAVLEAAGHTVIRYARSSDEVLRAGRPGMLRAGLSSVWSIQAYREIGSLLRTHDPDAAHFQNIHPLLSPSVYDACIQAGVPVVQALRNFRLLCPSGMYFRNGAVCELCRDKAVKEPAIRFGCYQGSRASSAAMAGMLAWHAWRKTFQRKVDVFVTPSQLVVDKFAQAGWDVSRFVVKPNIVGVPTRPSPCPIDSYALYLGRLSDEKGIHVLLEAFRALPHRKLVIAGSGVLEGMVRTAAARHADIEFTGRVTLEKGLDYIQGSSFLVFPSIWYETFGRTAIEAFGCGRPVVASRLGAVTEVVQHERNGLLFTPGSAADLCACADRLWTDPSLLQRLGAQAGADSQERYSAAANHDRLLEIYRYAREVRSSA
jgi:glycosyltransferase involved in cell wall biosynthesis